MESPTIGFQGLEITALIQGARIRSLLLRLPLRKLDGEGQRRPSSGMRHNQDRRALDVKFIARDPWNLHTHMQQILPPEDHSKRN
jgi:hypothetical protein